MTMDSAPSWSGLWQHPIFQAPMAGGADTPALTAAVSESGGLGFIGAAYLSPQQIETAAKAVRERSARPFGINLFAPQAPQPDLSTSQLNAAEQRLAPFFQQLGLTPPVLPRSYPADPYRDQLAACLECGAAAFSFTFGLLPPEDVRTLRTRGILVLGTATNLAEGKALQDLGVDAVIAQGSEAGGHRGTFATPFAQGQIGTMALVPQLVDALRIPVIASGGIMDRRGLRAAEALQATAVQMGTAFLTCHEAGIPEGYKAAILAAEAQNTQLTRVFSGRPARGIPNRTMHAIEGPLPPPADETPPGVLPFPWQNDLTRPLRQKAKQEGRTELLSLWCGQGASLARRQAASELMQRLVHPTADQPA